jgi:hypothetical protein
MSISNIDERFNVADLLLVNKDMSKSLIEYKNLIQKSHEY